MSKQLNFYLSKLKESHVFRNLQTFSSFIEVYD